MRRNSGEAISNNIKGHYIITKSNQDRVHNKNVTTVGQNLSVEPGISKYIMSCCNKQY